MAAITGQRIGLGYNVSSGNNDPALEKLDIASMLDMLHPTDVPLLTLVGRDSTRTPVTNVKHEWLEQATRGLSATTTDTDLDNTTPGVVALTLTTAADYAKFRGSTNDYDGPFDIVRITSTAGEELARVTATSSGGTISVDRGYASWSTPVDHTGYTKTITIIGSAQSQGLATVGEARTTTTANKFNYTQIFEDSLKYSATFQSTDKWIDRDVEGIDRQMLLENYGQLFERTLLYGKKQALANQDPGTMDGIRAVLSTNVYNKSSAALTEAHLADAMQDIWNAGASAGDRYLFTGPLQRRRINTFLEPFRQANYSDTKLGTMVDMYQAPFPGGPLKVVLDRHMPDNEVLIICPRYIGFGPLRGNGRDRGLGEYKSPLASNEAIQYQWIAEMTAEVRLEAAHARIHTLATTNLY